MIHNRHFKNLLLIQESQIVKSQFILEFFTENCVLFQEYLPPDIYKEFFMKKQKERGDFPIMFFQERQDNFEIEKLESKKKSQ